jgi:hypothetical protein
MPRWALFELVVSSSLQMVGLISRTYFHLSGNTSKGQVIGFSSNVGWGKRPSSWWSQALPTMIAKNLSFFCLFFSACSASILRLISTGFRTSPFSYVLWLWSFAFFFPPRLTSCLSLRTEGKCLPQSLVQSLSTFQFCSSLPCLSLLISDSSSRALASFYFVGLWLCYHLS